jgi:hypothetical protein
MTILEALKGINSYPIPQRTLEEVAERRNLELNAQATIEVMRKAGYNLAYADLLTWLSFAPQITQGGQSYSFTDEQRLQFRNRASELYEEYEETAPKARFGYKGSRL